VAVKNLPKPDLKILKRLGLIYFIYLFIYSGLEFTVTFLMYHKFNYTSIDQAKMFLTTGKCIFIFYKTDYLEKTSTEENWMAQVVVACRSLDTSRPRLNFVRGSNSKRNDKLLNKLTKFMCLDLLAD
jgi:hypothetical protein